MSFVKKKVSFDIDPKVLSDIKSFCKANDRKLSDFYRDAVREKLERERDNITIYTVGAKGNIDKFTISIHVEGLDIFEASQEMKENVGASNQGVLSIAENIQELDDELISHAIDNKIYFFTKDKYLREKLKQLQE